jgi:hypothetical protein
MKNYASAFAFRRALEDRLTAAACAESIGLQRMRRQVAFDRLLTRLFAEGNPPWCLKGGYALKLKFEVARGTKDIELGLSSEKLHADELLETLHNHPSPRQRHWRDAWQWQNLL